MRVQSEELTAALHLAPRGGCWSEEQVGISPPALLHLRVIPHVQPHVFLHSARLTFHNITLKLDLCNMGLKPMTEGFSLEIP